VSPFTAVSPGGPASAPPPGEDAVVIRRKRAAASLQRALTTVIRKKRYVHYREPSEHVVIKKRRGRGARESTRTRAQPDLHDGSRRRTTRESVGAGTGFASAPPARRRCRGAAGDKGGQDTTTGRSVAADPRKNRNGTGDAAAAASPFALVVRLGAGLFLARSRSIQAAPLRSRAADGATRAWQG